MPAIVAFVGVLILVALYLLAAAAALVFVSPPLTMAALAVGVLAGLVLGVQRTLTVLAGRAPSTPVRTPAQVVAGQLAGRVRAESIRRDYAWPQYFAVQVRLDLVSMTGVTILAARGLWAWTTRPLTRAQYRRLILFCWPLLLPVLAFLIGLSASIAAVVIVTVAIVGLGSAVIWTVGPAAVGLLRGADRGWQRVRRASGSCPRCYRVTSIPVYHCVGPHSTSDRQLGLDLHRDIRPGRLGVLWRRCGCGRRLPTTVLRASRSQQVRCPICAEPMHWGAGAVTDVRVPVFGAPSAGKTHLIMAGVESLLRVAAKRRIAVDFVDEHSLAVHAEYQKTVLSGQSATKTSTAAPVATTVRVRAGTRTALVHIFDAAGEALADSTQNAQLAYLDYARTLIFVLDPFAIRDVRDEAAAGFPETLSEANAATYDAEQSYHAIANRLHRYGVDTRRQRLAFVVSKSDLVKRLPIAAGLGSTSGSVRLWLSDRGLDNLVTAATRDFAEVRFFLVSAKDLSPDGAFAPLRWLLSAERVRV